MFPTKHRFQENNMNRTALIDGYLAGPQKLRDAIAGMTAEQVDAAPIAGKWSTRQVIAQHGGIKLVKRTV